MNISEELVKSLSQAQIEALRLISFECDLKGVNSFLVGGTVRDVLLTRHVHDIDIAMECHPSLVTDAMSSKMDLEVISQSVFGTQKIEIGDLKIDLAMTRTEEYSNPAALPKVSLSNLFDDLKRRDFTVNSMAMSLSHGSWGQILDPNDGLLDIEKKKIRTLHSNSFLDDPTRIFRAIRYSKRLGFTIDTMTDELITDSVKFVDGLSGLRIVNELVCICRENNLVPILEQLNKYGVLENIKKDWVLTDRIFRAIENLAKCTHFDINSFLVILVAGFNHLEREDLCFRLNLDNDARKSISDFETLESFDTSISPSALYNTLKPCSVSTINAGKNFFNKRRGEKILFFSDKLTNFRLGIDGNDLLTLGVEQGPMLGEFMRLLRDYALDQAITDKKAQLELAKKLLSDQLTD